jgi:phosphoribosylaminoimidazole (AIR) synthetase
MLRAFNMGVGLVIVCDAARADRVRQLLVETGEPDVWTIGHIEPGDRIVRYGNAA